MKVFLGAAGVLVLFGWIAPREVLAPMQEPRGKPHDDESVLETRMHAIEDELKALRRLLRDPAKSAEALAMLAKLQGDSLAAKSESPRFLAQIPEAERAKFLADYRREMVRFLEISLKVERALLDAKPAEAQVAFDELRATEDPAHAQFAPEDEDK